MKICCGAIIGDSYQVIGDSYRVIEDGYRVIGGSLGIK